MEWFDLFQKTIIKYRDIYNFNKSGFTIGISTTTKVITQSFYTGRRGVLQARNRE